MHRSTALTCCSLVLALALPLGAAAQDKPPRRDPLRLVSLGDSITEAINAEEWHPWEPLTENKWASWVNGYQRDWDDILDRTDVRSHNQRITEQFGKKKRKNKQAAKTGADSEDLFKQARKAVKGKGDYVTVLMGQNDVCGDEPSDIPTVEEFEANVRAGFEVLRAGLPAGATVYTLAIVDVHRLFEIGEDLEAFGILECSELWDLLRDEDIPCATVLDPDLSDAERLAVRDQIVAFNGVLASLVAEYEASDPQHHWQWTDVSFTLPWDDDDVSPFDCFHPSAEGQERLSEATWTVGPFAAP